MPPEYVKVTIEDLLKRAGLRFRDKPTIHLAWELMSGSDDGKPNFKHNIVEGKNDVRVYCFD